MQKAGLTTAAECGEPRLCQAVLKLRPLCLLAMYLGMYQAAGDSELGGYFLEHAFFSSYLDSLDVTMEDIRELAQTGGFLDTGEGGNRQEDEEVDYEFLCEIAMELVNEHNGSIFSALEDHYGGNIGLFVSLWNSRLHVDDIEPAESVVNSTYPGDGKAEVWMYVEEGMAGWWWS